MRPWIPHGGPYQACWGLSPDQVYRALTNPIALRDWFAEQVDIDLAAGRYAFWGRYAPAGDRPRQRLLSCQPGRDLRFAWSLGDEEREVAILVGPDARGFTTAEVQFKPDVGVDAPASVFWERSLNNLVHYLNGWPLNPRFDYTRLATDVAVARATINVPAEQVWHWLTSERLDPASFEYPDHAPITLRPRERCHPGWAAAPVEILEVVEERLLTVAWEEDGPPSTRLRWEITRGRASTTTVIITHSGFIDSGLAEAYRAEWHDTLVHIKECHTRPTEPLRHREQQRRHHLTGLHTALTELIQRRGEPSSSASQPKPPVESGPG